MQFLQKEETKIKIRCRCKERKRESKKKKHKLSVKKAVPAKYMTTRRGYWVLAIAKAKGVHLPTPLAA